MFGSKALRKRPAMATYIAIICSQWEITEELWGVLLADALDADARIGVELYLALTGSAAQAAVMTKAIELAVDDPQIRTTFAELLNQGRKRAKERNTIVHGRWGILESRDDALVLAERNWLPKAMADLNHRYLRMGETAPGPRREFPQQIWTASDFEETLKRLEGFEADQSALLNAIKEFRRPNS